MRSTITNELRIKSNTHRFRRGGEKQVGIPLCLALLVLLLASSIKFVCCYAVNLMREYAAMSFAKGSDAELKDKCRWENLMQKKECKTEKKCRNEKMQDEEFAAEW